MPSSISKNTTTNNFFSRTTLSRFVMSALLVGVAAGCSNNAADATGNTSVVNAAQTKDAPAKASADNDSAVVSALQANLKASGIEETIVSAVPTDMDGIYWV
ncbi:MAG TPA: thiol:disulfide interchange protein, partial [Psychrobacter sp.]|nr:thiol:disulfide interchange protein [Psychrobacter sp.]